MPKPHLLTDEIPVDRVRWFYGRGSAHANTWKPFRGADSISIENVFRAMKRNENCDGKVVVRAGLFEADLKTNMCNPIFWPGEKRSQVSEKKDWCKTPIQRGLWFNKINWIPLDFDLASLIEECHTKEVIPLLNEKENSKKSKKTIYKMNHKGYSVIWTSRGDIYLVTRSAQPFAHVKLNGDLSSVPIERGYNHIADPSDCKPPVTQLCFVVHGIGQRLASIRHECSKIRKLCLKVIKKRYPKLINSGQRIEFIPVDWRTPLNLNYSTLENITVGQMRPLRMYINNCFIDVLYYTSTVYRVEIMKSLSWELTRLFNLFLQHNPHFLQKGGQVSVLAHSLGTVIMHDILRSTNNPLQLVDPDAVNRPSRPDETSEAMQKVISEIEKKRLELLDMELKLMREIGNAASSPRQQPNSFLSTVQGPPSWKPLPQLSHLFLIGSPLGLFISLNSVPSTYNPTSPAADPPQSAPSSTHSHRRSRHRSGSRHPPSLSPDDALELSEQDPDALFPYSSCRRVYNIYHSYDPIAYRLEPLLLKHYSTVTPVVLPSPDTFFGKKYNKSGRFSESETSNSVRDSLISLGTSMEQNSPCGIVNPRNEFFGSIDGDDETPQSLCGPPMSESDTGSSDNDSVTSTQEMSKKLYKRISVGENQVYKQHRSKTFKFLSRYITRRSSHVTNLGPLLYQHRNEPEGDERRLRYRLDYEWQKSFSPLAVLGAHYSYWSSEELAFFILYQIFGHPDSIT